MKMAVNLARNGLGYGELYHKIIVRYIRRNYQKKYKII